MAGNIDGYFHDNVLVRGSEMAKITNALAGNRSFVVPNYAQGMNITASGLNVTVQPGFAIIQGHPVVIKQPMVLSLPANSTGYLVITIDKTKEVNFEGNPEEPGSYSWDNNQVALEYVASLVEGDLFNEDAIYTFPLANIVSNGTGLTITKIKENYAVEKTYKKTSAIPTGGVSINANKKYAIVTTDENGEQYLDINILATFIANPKEGIPLFNIGQTIKRNTVINVISAAGGISNLLRAEVMTDGGVYFWGLSTASASYHLTGRYWIV